MITTVIICLVCLALGMVFGYEWASKTPKKDESPVPDYDVNNPINANGRRGEIVEICGKQFVRMN